MLVVTVPLRTVSESNTHTHWRGRQRRARIQRHSVWAMLYATYGPAPPWPPGGWCCTLVRIAPRQLDSDNLQGSLKHVRDSVATDYFGTDDRTSRLSWHYDQRRGTPNEYAVEITIIPRTEGA